MFLVNRTNQNIDGKEGSQPTNVNLCNRIRYKTFMVSFLNREMKWILYLMQYQVTNESFLLMI
jgi:hypothetical protein